MLLGNLLSIVKKGSISRVKGGLINYCWNETISTVTR